MKLNESLSARGKPAVIIKQAPEPLEDDDILEMVNAGLVDVTVVDDFVAELWKQVFPNIRIHEQAAIRTGGEIAVGVRKNNPKMLQAVNTWVKEYGPRTAFGNIVAKRYLQDAGYLKNAARKPNARNYARGKALREVWRPVRRRLPPDGCAGIPGIHARPFGSQSVGAIGVMQVMPATGKELAVGDIKQIEPNIHAGVKYFRFMMDQYYKDEPMDDLNKGLMTLASYNAGPARSDNSARKPSTAGSIRTSGSATSRPSLPRRSGARPSSTSATSTSITSPTSSRWNGSGRLKRQRRARTSGASCHARECRDRRRAARP